MWRAVGREREIVYLTPAQLESIHQALIDDFADTDDPFGYPCGVREPALLESAAFRPQTSLGEHQKYPTVEMAVAALLHSLIHDHPFHNGNKRTALVAMLVMLDEHDLLLTCSEDEVFRLVLRVAQHSLVPRGADHLADREVLAVASWIRQNTRGIEWGERPIKWSRLRRILVGYGCTLEKARSVGNRMNIEREHLTRGFLGRTKRVALRTQVAYGDEGREVDRDTLKKIRKDLLLDEEHGIDSSAFYENACLPADFINRYRKTLKRLARL
nr:type II toxin-antitoxin system death-on-curing family toxin [Motilibacter deserti]